VGSEPPDVAHDRGVDFGRIDRVQVPIRISEEHDVADSEHASGRAELPFADLAKARAPRMVGTVAVLVKSAAFAARRGHEVDVHSLRRVPGEDAAQAQRLVVRMREHDEELQGASRRRIPSTFGIGHEWEPESFSWNEVSKEPKRSTSSPPART